MITVKNLKIGEGKPKIIVPIVGRTRKEILSATVSLVADKVPYDAVEWRFDMCEFGTDTQKVIATAGVLKEILDEAPLLCTFRTAKEGGGQEISSEDYAELLKALCASRNADMIDVELFTGDEIVRDIIETARANGIVTVASNHDFHETPDEEELLRRLKMMREIGADIPKIAVWPNCAKDVLKLLSATERMHEEYPDTPIITMSMGAIGSISRLAGETFGSAMTFGASPIQSAPGQLEAHHLDEVISIIHEGMTLEV